MELNPRPALSNEPGICSRASEEQDSGTGGCILTRPQLDRPGTEAFNAPGQSSPIVRKLANFVDLSPGEIAALESLSHNRKTFAAGETLVRQGSQPFSVFLILNGVAYRYKYLANGKRQISGYLLAGDVCDAHFVLSRHSDHDIGLLTDAEVAMIPMHELVAVMARYPNVRRALLKVSVVEDAILREWLLNVGQRSAPQKLAHFICEISERLLGVGNINPDGSYEVPLTQLEVADTMGLTVVHVSRCLQKFRREGLVHWSRRQLTILNLPRLRQVAGFDAGYLHIRSADLQSPDAAYARLAATERGQSPAVEISGRRNRG
jgi:CRP-like cAMP-binding protein